MGRDFEDETRARWNGARTLGDARRGAYESWFQRANHPTRPLAFWLRYTIFAPRGREVDAIGELWAIYFDGERRRVHAVKREHPIAACRFARDGLDVTIGDAWLRADALAGSATRGATRLAWSLRYGSPRAPLLLLPERLYRGGFPKAKVLVGSPLARYAGTLEVNDERVEVEGWVGSQNHNWGSEHTARYAWGQVAGFDDAADAFLEVTTAQVRLGALAGRSLLTPKMTILALSLDGEEHRFTSIPRALAARGRYRPFEWRFSTGDRRTHVEGTIAAPRWSFVALPYGNPPGGVKTCLNSKLASCRLRVERRGLPTRTLVTEHRAAFELLSDDPAPRDVATLAAR